MKIWMAMAAALALSVSAGAAQAQEKLKALAADEESAAAAESLKEQLDHDAQLALGEVYAEAVVRAGAKCDVAGLAVYVDHMRIGEHLGIAVGKHQRKVDFVPRLHLDAMKEMIAGKVAVRSAVRVALPTTAPAPVSAAEAPRVRVAVATVVAAAERAADR